MITVTISINNAPIYTRSCVNTGLIDKEDIDKTKEYCRYKCDDGTEIIHAPSDGAVALALHMLHTIHEVK